MDDRKGMAERCDTHCANLRAVAVRLLGSTAKADDAVREGWRRVSRRTRPHNPTEPQRLQPAGARHARVTTGAAHDAASASTNPLVSGPASRKR